MSKRYRKLGKFGKAVASNIKDDEGHFDKDKCGCGDKFHVKSGINLAEMLNDWLESRSDGDEDERANLVGEIAQNASVTEQSIYNVLSGKTKCPSRDRLDAFAEVLGVDIENILAAGREDGCNYKEE